MLQPTTVLHTYPADHPHPVNYTHPADHTHLRMLAVGDEFDDEPGHATPVKRPWSWRKQNPVWHQDDLSRLHHYDDGSKRPGYSADEATVAKKGWKSCFVSIILCAWWLVRDWDTALCSEDADLFQRALRPWQNTTRENPGTPNHNCSIHN